MRYDGKRANLSFMDRNTRELRHSSTGVSSDVLPTVQLNFTRVCGAAAIEEYFSRHPDEFYGKQTVELVD
ncbi:hypothetical protein [Rhodococcus sp. UNC363MFTsu5.1]|uniref:hypothetical protein n=1 Tax=Rhodococcus sp. UNC363MFTsu5.1 TaxID=1449069 RepID=UPI000AD44F80|nr:hypothetical protein [Rhodococcus sp. UNC363MFTsu5.1]